MQHSTTPCPRTWTYFLPPQDLLVQLVQAEIVSADLVKKEQVLAYGGQCGVNVLTQTLHRTPEYSRKIWAGADERCLIKEMQTSIQEYFDSHDCEEVARIVGRIDCEEVVRRI